MLVRSPTTSQTLRAAREPDGIADAQSWRPRERRLRYRHDRDSKLAGRRLRVDDYLSKPIDFEMLRVVVENRLRRANGRRALGRQVHLTQREKEVFTWVARGKTSAEIAIILWLSDRTVNFHCDLAMKRLNVINRTQAVATTICQGSLGI